MHIWHFKPPKSKNKFGVHPTWHLPTIGDCQSKQSVSISLLTCCKLNFCRMYLLKYDCQSSVTLVLESNKDGIYIPWALMHTLGAFSNCSLHNLHFCLSQNGGIINLTKQVLLIVFLIASMRITLLLSFSLVCDKRRSQFSTCSGSWLVFFWQAVFSPWPVFCSV